VKLLPIGLLLVAACSARRTDPERIGDTAWHDGRWHDAAASYHAATPSPRLLAKYADASFLAGERLEAIAAWSELGRVAPERVGEAAASLARVAKAAEGSDEPLVLARAVLALRRLAPDWPLGRMAIRLVAVPGIAPEDVVVLLPVALASVSARSTADSVLLSLGAAERQRGACDPAVPVLEAVLRRSPVEPSREAATALLADCELTLGLAALNAEAPGEAERWLDRAARRDPTGSVGRRALVGFGDARLRQGDPFSATLAWQEVASARVAADSITILALERLRIAGSADSTVHPAAVPDRP
jgi:tetratricopeptide (TPR) repeat protein